MRLFYFIYSIETGGKSTKNLPQNLRNSTNLSTPPFSTWFTLHRSTAPLAAAELEVPTCAGWDFSESARALWPRPEEGVRTRVLRGLSKNPDRDYTSTWLFGKDYSLLFPMIDIRSDVVKAKPLREFVNFDVACPLSGTELGGHVIPFHANPVLKAVNGTLYAVCAYHEIRIFIRNAKTIKQILDAGILKTISKEKSNGPK